MNEDHDPLDNLFAEPAAPQEAPVVPPVVEDKPVLEEPAKDDLKKEDAEVEGTTKMVPKAALDEARQRARDAEERLANASKPKEAAEEAPTERRIPDPKEDPEGFAEHLIGNVQLNLVNQTLNNSERWARKEHGGELVDKVRDWVLERFEKDPEFARKVLSDPDPYEAAIADYNAMQATEAASKLDPEVLKGLDDEELALLKAHRASKAAPPSDDPAQPRSDDGKFKERRTVEAPPASLANLPGGGKATKDVATGEGVAFDSAFGGR